MNLFKKIILLLVLSFIGCAQVQSGHEYYVSKVIDGDTIELDNGQRVRYLGLDAPETRKRQRETWVYAPEPYAEAAMEFNRKLVDGKQVRLEFDVQKKDKYDRLLVYCFVGDVFVNAELLKNGYALLYTSAPNVKYVDILVKMQQDARQNNRGLWAEIRQVPAKEAKKYVGRIVAVEGKVTSIHQTPKVTFLNFGQSGFQVVIFKEQLAIFMTNAVSVRAYKGKALRITGKVMEYRGGAEIIVRHPSAIEVLD